MTYIIALRRSSWLRVTKLQKWNWLVSTKPGSGKLNDEKALKVMRGVPVILNRKEEEYLGTRGRPV